jgi:hypothetical protein
MMMERVCLPLTAPSAHSLVGVRCTERPPSDCEDVGGPHIHWGCTHCPSHWVEPNIRALLR